MQCNDGDTTHAQSRISSSKKIEATPYCKPKWLSSESYGLILLLISAVLFSFNGLFLKLASENGLPSTELAVCRATFQGILVVIGMTRYRQDGYLLIRRPFGITSHEMKVVISRGAVGGGGFILYFYSIKSLPLGDAITLFSLYPIITIFLARCVLNESIKCSQLLAALFCATGAALIAGPSFLASSQYENTTGTETYNPLGYFTACVGCLFGATVVVLVRKAGTMGIHTLQLLFSWAVFGIVFGLVLGMSAVGSALESPWVLPKRNIEWLYILAMCSFGSMAHFLMNYATMLGPAGLSAIARSSDILWSYLFEVIIFHQVPTSTTVLGVGCIMFALAGIAFEKVKEERIKRKKILTTSVIEISEEGTPLLRNKKSSHLTFTIQNEVKLRSTESTSCSV